MLVQQEPHAGGACQKVYFFGFNSVTQSPVHIIHSLKDYIRVLATESTVSRKLLEDRTVLY